MSRHDSKRSRINRAISGWKRSLQFVDDLLAEYAAELSALAEIARADTTVDLKLPKLRFV